MRIDTVSSARSAGSEADIAETAITAAGATCSTAGGETEVVDARAESVGLEAAG